MAPSSRAAPDGATGSETGFHAPPAGFQATPAGFQAPGATGAVVLADGSVLYGRGFGAAGTAVGEICFNTAMTGYQEALTDPSYAGQIITFTFPHIGNVGANEADMETGSPATRGLITRADLTGPSNWRAARSLDDWLKAMDLPGVAGVDTRALTQRIRDTGAPNGVIVHDPAGQFDIDHLLAQARAWPGLTGMDLAREVTARQTYVWTDGLWRWDEAPRRPASPGRHIVAVDYGAKRNILRHLAEREAKVTVVPATASAEDILRHRPDGVFLSNGPGDPQATGAYAVPALRQVLATGVPTFGICLGHQILALALGARTEKLHLGHRGSNHPVQDLTTGKVEITSQNHGFAVMEESLGEGIEVTHRSLFDGTNEGLRVSDRPIFSVQYHPEASPGPRESSYLFDRFFDLIDQRA